MNATNKPASAGYFQRLGCGILALVILGICLHLYGCLPSSRLAPRSFVMKRDYRDMLRVFKTDHLPESFRIAAVKYPFGRGMQDGPPPVQYSARITAEDYRTLTANLQRYIIPVDHKYGRLAAVYEFNPGFLDEYCQWEYESEDSETSTAVIAELYEVEILNSDGYATRSDILADLRTTSPIHLYITTWVPFSE